jgi:hypothetical protein
MTDTPKQRIADLERELRLRDERIRDLKADIRSDGERIRELRDEVDQSRKLVHEMEEHVQERDEYLETFITTFGLELDDDGNWRNGEFIQGYNALVNRFNELIDRYNKLVRDFNQYAVPPKPVGRPLAASEAQQAQVIKHHKAGKSARWIAEEMTLSRRTVTTVIDKLDGSDRNTQKRRRQLGLESKRKDWRPAAMARLPKRATEHFEKGRELLKEAKGLK